MKESEFKQLEEAVRTTQPTPRRGVLDDLKKAHVVLLIASGLSRREAAHFMQCAHTTIGRTAARDPDFATKLSQAEATSHIEAVNRIRGAAQDPKYWRAAAWMLERRSPEEYARRDPNTFTADQVMSLLARFYSEVQPIVQAGKNEQFEQSFDDVLEAIEAKSGGAIRKQGSPDEEDAQRTHLAARDAHAAECETSPVEVNTAATPAQNGHHRPQAGPAVAAASQNGKPHAEREEYVAPKQNGSRTVPRFTAAQMHHPDQQGVVSLAEDASCKALPANALQRQSADCTTAGKAAGRCNKEAQPCNGEAPRTPA